MPEGKIDLVWFSLNILVRKWLKLDNLSVQKISNNLT